MASQPSMILPALPALRLVRTPGPARRLAWTLLALGVLSVPTLGLVPWQQTVRASGRVFTRNPNDRVQTVDAPIDGRVSIVHVVEGSRVEAGQLLVELVDNDPRFVDRLDEERQAALDRRASAQQAVTANENRVMELLEAKMRALGAAEARVAMARDRMEAADQRRVESEGALGLAKFRLAQTEKMFAEGLASERDRETLRFELTRAETGLAQAEAAYSAARSEETSMLGDLGRITAEADANVSAAKAVRDAAEQAEATAAAELARTDVRVARQATQRVVAPRAGRVLRVLANPGSEQLKAGDSLIVLVPETDDRAVEVYVSGNDASLVQDGREVRLQFEGWPAVQFVGWPSVAVGTFPGVVALVDASDDGSGRFRVLVVPDPNGEPWPDGDVLRQGVRANGWVLLDTVPLGFEIWRQLNGFPPVVAAPEKPKVGDPVKLPKDAK